MSLLNWVVTPGRVVVSTDTLTLMADGAVRHRSKFVPLPHLGAVVAGRGFVDFVRAVAESAWWECSTFDGVLARLPDLIAGGRARLPQDLLAALPRPQPQELVVAGWSEARSAMVGALATGDLTSGAGFVIAESEGEIAPWEEAQGPPPCAADTDADLLALARWQLRHWAARTPAIGGRLLVVELRATPSGRTSAAVRDLGDIEGPSSS